MGKEPTQLCPCNYRLWLSFPIYKPQPYLLYTGCNNVN